MTRKHFFESLERENDYQYEYVKLETLCAEQVYDSYYGGYHSINGWIEKNFIRWYKRDNYLSYAEVRRVMGLSETKINGMYIPVDDIDLNKYVLFSEMLFNIIYGIMANTDDPKIPSGNVDALFKTIKATISKAGFEVKQIDGIYYIVEINAVAIEVADNNPNLADTIIEYNHFLLKGDINKKRQLLKLIADVLEPKRKDLKEINKSVSEDFFHMVNKCNIRHNNMDPNDKNNYFAEFAELSKMQQEEWYDIIYEQALTLFVLLEQKQRSEKIRSFLYKDKTGAN